MVNPASILNGRTSIGGAKPNVALLKLLGVNAAPALNASPAIAIGPSAPFVVALSSKRQIKYWFSKRFFQKILVPGEHPHDAQPFIIVPLESKLSNFAFVKRIRKLETTAIMKADEVIIIGWSLPETDKDQENIIRSAIAKRSKPIARLTVISRSSPPEHFSRFSKIFDLPKKNVRVFNAGFESFVEQAGSLGCDSK